MANIPGSGSWTLPGCDPVIDIVIGTSEGRLVTDNFGSEFRIEGNIRLAAIATLRYVTQGSAYGSMYSAYCPKRNKITAIQLSKLYFNLEDGIKVRPYDKNENSEVVLRLIDEIKKVIELKAFM